jgi:hypothetical protein
MRWYYEDARNLDVAELRNSKPKFLANFRDDGCYLVDASETPMPKGSSVSAKKRLLRDALPALTERLRNLVTDDTKIVLISSRVFSVCSQPLRAAGLNVVNTESIDFPATGHQRAFARKLGQLLDEHLSDVVAALEESVRFYGHGKHKQKERERYVAERFLKGVGLHFDCSEIEQPEVDPPDVKFRTARFEIKEVQDPGRRRHDEYRERLQKARNAERAADLVESFSPTDVSITSILDRLQGEAERLLDKNTYRCPQVRRNLDLLFYVNLQKAWGIEDAPWPDLTAFRSQGWRSVSFLKGAHTCCVVFANEDAPDFLRQRQGRILIPESFD